MAIARSRASFVTQRGASRASRRNPYLSPTAEQLLAESIHDKAPQVQPWLEHPTLVALREQLGTPEK